MFEPHVDFRYDYRALPPIWRVTSLVLSAAIVVAVAIETLAAAGVAA